MRILKGATKQEHIQERVQEYILWILENKPKYISTADMDAQIRIPLIEGLLRAFVLTEWQGKKIGLFYLSKE